MIEAFHFLQLLRLRQQDAPTDGGTANRIDPYALNDVAQRMQHQEHVQIDIGHDAVERHGRVGSEELAAQKPLLLTRHGEKQDRAAWCLRQAAHGFQNAFVIGQLGFGRQFAVENQVGDFFELAVFSQVFYVVAAVGQTGAGYAYGGQCGFTSWGECHGPCVAAP